MSLINQLIQKVNDLTTVVNSIIANAKDMAALPDATVPVSGTDKMRITQGGVDRKVDISEVGGSGDAVARMRWMNEWIFATYETNDVVVDGAYTMVANKLTAERPSPQLIGDTTWMYDGTIGTDLNSAKLIISGADYTLVNALSISKYRLDVILGNHYALYLVVDPDLTNVKSKIIDFIATETGWNEVAIPSEIIPAGTNFRVLLATNEPDPTPVSWTGDWDYDTPNNDGTPAAGGILHSNNDSSLFNIHKTDDNGGDRGAELLALSVGDIIDGVGTRWTIGSINDNGTYITFGVSPTLQGTPDGVSTFTFETVSATPITTGLDTDYFLGNANIRGLFAIDGSLDDVVENDNGYGVDIELQQVTVSDDWDFLAISGGAGGSSSSGGGDIEIVDNLTTQDSTKALSANQGYVLDQSKSNVGHTHSGTLGDILIKTADYSTLNNDAESDATLVFRAPATSVLLDSTAGVSVGFRQEVINNTGGVLTISLIGTDTTIGELPASIPDGQMAYYTLVEATIWAVAYGEEVAAHSLTDHTDVNIITPSPNDRLAWDNVSGKWIPKASLSALGFVEFSYKMDLPAETNPVAGDVSRDTDNPATTTTLYFNKLDSAGNDKSLFFQEFKAGDWINLHDDADVVNEESYNITGVATLVGDVWEIPVSLYEVGGTTLANNDDLQVFWRIRTADEVKYFEEDVTLGETVAVNDVLYLESDGLWYKAIASQVRCCTSRLLCAVSGGSLGQTVTVYNVAAVKYTGAVSMGDPMYLSWTVAGGYTTTKPTDNNFLKIIGYITVDSHNWFPEDRYFHFTPNWDYMKGNGEEVNGVQLPVVGFSQAGSILITNLGGGVHKIDGSKFRKNVQLISSAATTAAISPDAQGGVLYWRTSDSPIQLNLTQDGTFDATSIKSCRIGQEGLGQITLDTATYGVTLRCKMTTPRPAGRYSTILLEWISTTEILVTGDLEVN